MVQNLEGNEHTSGCALMWLHQPRQDACLGVRPCGLADSYRTVTRTTFAGTKSAASVLHANTATS